MGVLHHEGFLDLLRAGLKFKDALCEFASIFIETYAELFENSTDYVALSSPEFEPVASALKRIHNLCKTIAHFFCLEGLPVQLQDQDVVDYVHYKGKQYPERTLALVLSEQGSFWEGELNDMIKKGAANALSQEKLADLDASLKDTSRMNLSRLRTSRQQLEELQNAARSQTLTKLRDMFSASRLWVQFFRGCGFGFEDCLQCCQSHSKQSESESLTID